MSNRVESIFIIQPQFLFGRPDSNFTVVPSGTSVSSPSLDTKTGELSGGETLSIYRSAPIEWSAKVADIHISLFDGTLRVSSEHEDYREALTVNESMATQLCLLLSQQNEFSVYCEFKYAFNELTQSKLQLPHVIHLANMAAYNLKGLQNQLDTCVARMGTMEAKAEKSLAYLGHAYRLHKLIQNSDRGDLLGRYLLNTDIVLHCYKSISCIIGDPPIDSDYQSRYRSIGITPETWAESEDIRKTIRNKLDVAHYRLDWNASSEISAAMPRAMKLAKSVLDQYFTHLLS